MPGVVRVLTHADVPNNWYTILRLIGVEPNDEPVLPEDRVLYKGEPIVAVVAETRGGRAARAPPRSRSTTRTCPPCFDVEEALAEGAPRSSRTGTNYFIYEGHHCRRIRFGDVEQAFAQADHVFEWRYQSSPIEHAPTETTGCIVVPQADGRLQHPLRHAGVLLHARQHRADPRRRRSTSCASSAARSAAASAARST